MDRRITLGRGPRSDGRADAARVPDQPVPVFTAGDPPRLERACAGRAFAERRDAALIAVFGRPVSAPRSWPESAPAPAAREPAAATTASWRTGRDTSHHRSKGTAARTAKSGPRPQITVRQCRPALARCLMSYSPASKRRGAEGAAKMLQTAESECPSI
jgi:hypothetical protein